MWRIHLCGELRVDYAGARREAQLRGRQGRLAFAYLVLHRDRPVRRDALIEALWSHEGAPPSDTALAPVLSRLRRAVEPAVLAGRDTLRLTFTEPVWVDVEAIAELARAGDPESAQEAAALAAPGLLPDLDAPWLSSWRNDLEELRVEALEQVAQAGLRDRDALPGAERAARAAVSAAPFRESSRAALISVLARRGNIAEAVLAYDEFRVLLREELGTVPGPELVALYEQLLEPPPVPVPKAPTGLLERDGELAAIAVALHRLSAGEGGVLAFEGPAGIGKTRLLGVLRERAVESGAAILDARAGVLEREFGFGVVRQLFEAAAATDPPPAGARAVFGEGSTGDGLFAVLSALFSYTATLAARRPLVLCIDDLQWSDTSSLRFVAYLTRRIAGLPVLVATTIRTGEPDSDELLLGEIGQDPATVAVQPKPLTADGTLGLVSSLLGDADGAFAAACQDVTAGNPLLLRQLLTALAAEQVVPDAEHAASVRAIGPRAVSRTVLLRLARLPAPAAAVARAIAVLGEQAGLPAIAALAQTGEGEAAEAIEALARAEILRADEAFVHPLVRDAVYGELPAARRGLEHARAARLLADLGVSPERIAAQLMLAPPRADAWVVERLREAAAIAIERGAPDAALSHLQRAQAEPPAPELRSALMLELGAAAEFVRGKAAAETLALAHAGLTDPAARGMAAIMLARTLLFMENPAEAMDVIDSAHAELPAEYEDLHLALRALRIVGVFFGVADPANLAEVEAWRAGPRAQGPGAKTLTAITALAVAIQSGDAQEAAALAAESLDGDEMPAFDRGIFTALPAAALAMAEPASADAGVAAHPGAGRSTWVGAGRRRRRPLGRVDERLDRRSARGDRATRASDGGRGALRPLGAPAHGLRARRSSPWPGTSAATGERAWEALRRSGDRTGTSDGERFWMISHAELLLADAEYAPVHTIADALATSRPPDTHPLWSPWRSLRARAAAGEGDRATASRLAAEELALARRSAAPWVVGRALRVLGELTGDAAALREAVVLLDGTSARLERAKAHAALGNVATALELAERCGADGLAERLRSRLAA